MVSQEGKLPKYIMRFYNYTIVLACSVSMFPYPTFWELLPLNNISTTAGTPYSSVWIVWQTLLNPKSFNLGKKILYKFNLIQVSVTNNIETEKKLYKTECMDFFCKY